MGATEVFNTTGAKIRRRTTRQDLRTGLRSRRSEADIREYVRVKCMANEKSTLTTTMSALLRIDKPNVDKETLDKMIIDAITSNNNLVNEVGPDQATPLHSAILHERKAIVDGLVANGANIQAQDAKLRLPLHYAAKTKGKEFIEALQLKDDSSMACARDCYGRTAFAIACKSGSDEVALYLLHRFPNAALCADNPLTAQTMDGDSALHIAARKGHESRVDCLLEMSSEAPDATGFEEILNSSGETALDCALRESHFAIAEKLAVKMVDIRFIDEMSRNDVLEKLVKAKQHTLIAMLLYKEAESQNIPGVHTISSHATALELATYRGLTNLVRLLLENMALSSIRDPSIQAARRVCERELERRGPADDRGNESDDSSPPETQSYENFEQILDLLQWPPTLTSSTPYSLRLADRDPEQLPDVASNYRVMLVDIDDKELRQYSLPLTEFMENKASWRVMEVYKERTEARDKPRQLETNTDVNVKWVHLPANSMQWMEDTATILAKNANMDLDSLSWFSSTWTELRRRSNQTGYMKPQWVANPDDPTRFAAYIPYLAPAWYCMGYDPHRIQYRNLLRHYESKTLPFHGSRTLDEYFLHFCADSLDIQKSILERNKDQVLSRALHIDVGDRKHWVLINVDHLWIWALDERTIPTSVTHRRDSEPDPLASAALQVLQEVMNTHGCAPKNAEQMARFIMDICVDFFGHTFNMQSEASKVVDSHIMHLPKDVDMACPFESEAEESLSSPSVPARLGTLRVCIKECFTDRLAHHAMQESEIYKRFVNQEVSPPKRKAMAAKGGAQAAQLCREIKDIRDELDIIRTVVNSQKTVFAGLDRNSATSSSRHLRDVTEELDSMEKAAKRIEAALNATLTLQQNAVAIEQAHAAVRQGKVMMVLTTFTVLFLPSSAFSSLFSMQVDSFMKTPGWAFSIMSLPILESVRVTDETLVGVSAVSLLLTGAYAWFVFWKRPQPQRAKSWRDWRHAQWPYMPGQVSDATWSLVQWCEGVYRSESWREALPVRLRQLGNLVRFKKSTKVERFDV